MKLQRKGSFGLLFLVLSLFAGILFNIGDLNTSSLLLYTDKNDYIPAIQSTSNINPAAFQVLTPFSMHEYQSRDTGIAEGHALINSSDCYTCHAEYKIVLAPSFSEIAARYKNDKAAIQKLANKVILGSIGIWGDKLMPAHPEFLQEDAQKMIQYILNLNKKKDSTKLLL